MPLILGTNSIKDTGYNVANSVRFNDGSGDELTRSQGSSPSSRRLFTFSAWVKRSSLNSGGSDPNMQFFSQHNDTSDRMDFRFQSGDTIDFRNNSPRCRITTDRLFRDVSSWYHICLRVDTTQSTAANRIRLYINGVQETSFSTADYGDQNDDLITNASTFDVGDDSYGTAHFDGYMCEVVYCDGQSLAPTSFGEFDEDSPTIWKPIDVSGLTFGTNGFHLDFENASSLGADVSGNSNNFTVNNLTSVDQSTDTCTNNFATLNPLDVLDDDGRTLSEGNLNFTTSSGNNGNISGTQAVSGSGKWYFETKISAQSGSTSSSAKFGIVGIRDLDKSDPYVAGNSYYIYSDGRKEDGANTTNSAHPGYSLNDIVQVALDLDNGNIYFGLNGNWGDNSGNFNQTFGNATAFFTSINTSGFWSAYFVKNVTADNALTLSVNFGSPSFAISSGNSDGNGYGNFEYSVPSGYYSINTKNLAEFG